VPDNGLNELKKAVHRCKYIKVLCLTAYTTSIST